MRPVISNIGTATYEIAKYLNKLLTPLNKTDYNILNTGDLIRRLREEIIPAGYKIISFDVKSLFTNVPLDKTIDYILKKVYNEKKIQTNIPKTVLKELLYLCTKQLHFTFNNSIYIQCGGVAMGFCVRIFTSKYLHDITRGRTNTNTKIISLQLETIPR